MGQKNTKKRGSGTGLNLMDFVVCLLILICLVGAVIRIGRVNWLANDSDLDDYEVYFSVNNISYIAEDAFVKGDTVTLCENGMVLGTLKSIDSVLPTTMYVKDLDGNVLSVNYPESTRIDLTGTILSKGQMEEDGYFLGGRVYIAPGKTYAVQSEHMDFTLTVLDIEED